MPALRLKHRSGSCGTASALPKCSIMSGCGTRIVLRGQKPLTLCDRCPCFGSLFPPLAALTFAASSIICAFGLPSAAPRSPYRHLELCGIALILYLYKQAYPSAAPYWAARRGMCFAFIRFYLLPTSAFLLTLFAAPLPRGQNAPKSYVPALRSCSRAWYPAQRRGCCGKCCSQCWGYPALGGAAAP